MPILHDYHEFDGLHPETGTVRNALAFQGIKAPHTAQPLSEALLLGISGGVAVGYFTFEYKGFPPHIALLTRNTFDPLETLFERLALPRELLQSTTPEKGEANLCAVLESGRPALVWADMYSLAYNDLPPDYAWAVLPVLVYGLEGGRAYLADRAATPLIIAAGDLQAARARIKKYRHGLLAFEAPDLRHLPAAVTKGIWQCLSLYTDAPPKGTRENFGLAALENWAQLLTNTRAKQGWARYFARGERLWMALAGNITQPGLFSWIGQGAGNAAERGMYADFLNEAAAILQKPALHDAAHLFRQAEAQWAVLGAMVLPDDVPVFKETATLLAGKKRAFREGGAAALPEIQKANARLRAIHEEVSAAFPLSADEVKEFFARLAAQVRAILQAERAAVTCLQEAMA